MKILLVAATSFEILPLFNSFQSKTEGDSQEYYLSDESKLKFLVTGTGILNTTYKLTKELSENKPDLAINMGIAGAFDRDLKIGEVVHVISERHGDLGAENEDGSFLDMQELGLSDLSEPLKNTDAAHFNFLKKAHGLTVNKVHGATGSIQMIRAKYPDVQVESMEGAAFFHVCQSEKIKFLEVRAISNYVEPRNKENWNISLAIDNLNKVVGELIHIVGSQKSA